MGKREIQIESELRAPSIDFIQHHKTGEIIKSTGDTMHLWVDKSLCNEKRNPEGSHNMKQVARRQGIHSDADRRDVFRGKKVL